MHKRKRIGLSLSIGVLILVLGLLCWFSIDIFEGEKPGITLDPINKFISGVQKYKLTITDRERGLRTLKVYVKQGGREVTVLEKAFPFKGLFNREGIHRYDTDFSIDPAKLNLYQGRIDLFVCVRDYSRRSGGDGNLSLLQHRMVVDMIPPSIRAVSRLHYVNVGGSGLVIYQTSSDSVKSGLFVNEDFFPGFPSQNGDRQGLHLCYFAVRSDTKPNPDIYLWSEDRAGNSSRANFYFRIRKKRFPTDKMRITDRFLKRILPRFSYYPFEPEDNDITKFLKINREVRKGNNLTFYSLRKDTSPDRLWSGNWIRLKNAASMAGFGDRRLYLYKGKKVDKQIHLGVDLASLANSEVQATNNGRVIFGDRLGIYGLTVVLDHGQGLASVYSHLSEIRVKPGQEVMKGEIVGTTGQTGLAGGDHLHFGIMISGVFVNPIEWWDTHWIQDNITRKLALLDRE
ncbi:MAG: M23 family metallopeptidase [Thermodesulfobacteriota bacterium]|nr:M23 family metallopeptidase [Thermodesulfobacteriota bacterium]